MERRDRPRGQRGPGGPGRHMHFHRKVFKVLLIIFILAFVCFLPARFIMGVVTSTFHWRENTFLWLVTGFLWIALLYFVFSGCFHLFLHIRGKARIEKAQNSYDEVIEAIERITEGDFSVILEVDDQTYVHTLAEKINTMASELSTMEQMRQDFVANVSHEIQSPLTSISGFASLLKKKELSAEEKHHYLNIIEAESARLSKLSDNLLALSQLDANAAPFHPKEFCLDKQMQDVLLLLEPQWSEKGVEVELLGEKNIACRGDRDLLEQVWINLIHNAIKFTPEGGRVTVSLSKGEDEVICKVADTGIGIPKESLSRLFERFYKVDKSRDRAQGGNGLGLSLVHKIVKLHGGSVSAESQLGEGTAFTVILPERGKNKKQDGDCD